MPIEMSPRAKRRYARKRRREQDALDARCAELAGPVTVSYLPGRHPGPKGAAEECSAERSRAPRDNGGARGGTRLGNPCDEDGLTR